MRRVFASATWLPLGLRHAPGRIVLAAALGGLLGPLPAARAQSHPDQRQFQLRIQELKLQQAQQQLTQQQQFQQQQLQVQPAPLQQQQFQLQQLHQQQMQMEQIESLRLQVQQQNQIQRSLTNRGAVP
jgi:hypothetical protein